MSDGDHIPGLPEPNLSAELTYDQWCTVLMQVASGPYRTVKPIIDRLMEQLGPQADLQQAQALLAVTPAVSDSRN